MADADTGRLPPRFERPGAIAFLGYFAGIAFVIASIDGLGVSLADFAEGAPAVLRMAARMIPPDLSRIDVLASSLIETFQMAVVGTLIGLVLSLPLAVLAARGLSPHPLVAILARGLIGFFRTVPDLIWALVFVIAVGLGPFAGTLAIAVDTIGFCGRFFAEAMEEADRGPQEALRALGAGRLGTIASAVVPAALPSFVATALFSLEKATRASVILGLVGAGGIGIELKVAMEMFAYEQASTVILLVFALVLAVEQAGGALRRRLL